MFLVVAESQYLALEVDVSAYLEEVENLLCALELLVFLVVAESQYLALEVDVSAYLEEVENLLYALSVCACHYPFCTRHHRVCLAEGHGFLWNAFSYFVSFHCHLQHHDQRCSSDAVPPVPVRQPYSAVLLASPSIARSLDSSLPFQSLHLALPVIFILAVRGPMLTAY